MQASGESREPQRSELILANRHRVRFNAMQIIRERSLPMSLREDLESYGTIGLIRAADHFDFDRGVQFGTYAEYVIRGAIQDGLRTWCKGQQLGAQLRGEQQDEAPTDSPAPVDSFIERMSQVVLAIAHDRLSEDTGRLGSDAEGDSPEDHLLKQEQIAKLSALLQEMDPHRREVLQLSYIAELRNVDIAKKLGMHKSSVTKLRDRALTTLRKQMDAADDDSEESDDAG